MIAKIVLVLKFDIKNIITIACILKPRFLMLDLILGLEIFRLSWFSNISLKEDKKLYNMYINFRYNPTGHSTAKCL